MVNTSATGGPLAPAAQPAPLQGQKLNRFIQDWFCGMTGLDGEMVRPRWQAEPPNVPDAGDAWLSFAVQVSASDTFPQVRHIGDGEGKDELRRNETIEILASFYDLGTNGLADDYAARLRDGLAIAQNREPLQLEGMGLVGVGDLLTVPTLLKLRWLYRVDLRVTIRRMVGREYPVLNIQSAGGTIETPSVTIDFNA